MPFSSHWPRSKRPQNKMKESIGAVLPIKKKSNFDGSLRRKSWIGSNANGIEFDYDGGTRSDSEVEPSNRAGVGGRGMGSNGAIKKKKKKEKRPMETFRLILPLKIKRNADLRSPNCRFFIEFREKDKKNKTKRRPFFQRPTRSKSERIQSFYRVSPSFTEFCRVLLGINHIKWVSPGFNHFNWV